MRAFAEEVWSTLDVTAAIDIAVVAVLVYLALIGLQRARTAYAVRGALVLGSAYLIARQFSLSLTSAALEAALVILAVALVMVYREELRRVVERIAKLTRRTAAVGGATKSLEVWLAESLFELAAERCGALIVIACDDPVDPHLTGGTRLGGEPSAALLKSIFDPSSVGHDGALVIDRGVVTRFGAHLPLTKDLDALGDRGTRHAAALGLTQRCDALCIVVSEERGSVSVAQAGELREIPDTADLEATIGGSAGDTSAPISGWLTLLTAHHGAKLLAVMIASAAWLVLVYGGQPIQQSMPARIATRDLPKGLRLVEVTPSEVRIVATGARRDFALASRSPVRVVLTLDDAKPGQSRVRVVPEDVHLPSGLLLKSVQPPDVTATVARD